MIETSLRKFFIGFISIVVLFVGYWVFDALRVPPRISSQAVVSSDPTPSFLSGPFERSITQMPTNKVSVDSNSNLTKHIVNDMSSNLVASLQKGSSTDQQELLDVLQKSGYQAINPESLSAYANPTTLGLLQDIPDSQIHITDDDSAEERTVYKDEYARIIQPLAELVNDSDIKNALDSFVKTGDPNGLDDLIKVYKSVYTRLYTTIVPRSLVTFHKESLLFFVNEEVVFSGLRAYNEDPLRAYLLGEQLTNLSEMWNNLMIAYQKI